MKPIDLYQESFRIYRERKQAFHFLTAVMAVFAVFYVKDLALNLPLLLITCLIAGGFFIYLSLKDPFLAVMTLAAYLPFSGRFSAGFSRISPMLSPTLVLFGFILWLIAKGRLKGPQKWEMPPGAPVVIFFAGWMLLSVLRNLYFGEEYIIKAAGQFWQSWLFPILLYYFFYNLVRSRDEKMIVLAIIIGAVFLTALLASFSYFDGERRVGGIFNHPNRLAAFFNYYMFLAPGILLCNARIPKNWLLAVPFLASVRGMMVTFSRGGYAAFMLGLFIIAFYRNKILFVFMAAAAVFIYSHPQYLPDGVRWRLGQTVKDTYVHNTGQHYRQVDPSLGNRFIVWDAAIEMIKDDPVWGVGYNRFRTTIQNYWKEGIPFDAHNTFLSIGVESGVPAAGALVVIILIFFGRGTWVYYKTRDPLIRGAALGFLGGIGGYVVSNLYVSRLDFTEIIAYFWILAALVLQSETVKTHDQVTEKAV